MPHAPQNNFIAGTVEIKQYDNVSKLNEIKVKPT